MGSMGVGAAVALAGSSFSCHIQLCGGLVKDCRSSAAPRQRLVKAGGNHRDPDLVVHILVKVAPKMVSASGWTACCTREAACSTSSRPMSMDPVTLMRTPLAPSIEVSSSGLE